MKLEGKISVLINRDGTTIEVEDENANAKFLKITLTPEQLSAALSRQMAVDCEIEVIGIEKIGKKHENKSFEFQIPNELASTRNETELQKLAQSLLSDGWVAERYFSSQTSFFKKDGIQYARCTIRRWV
jgi:hypothetical protein